MNKNKNYFDQIRVESKTFWDNSFYISNYNYKALTQKDWSVFINKLKLNNISSILDFGTGGGHWSIVLSKAGFIVTAIDFSSVAIQKLIIWAKEENLLINTKINSLQTFCIINEKFDSVICNSVLDHLLPTDAEQAMNNIFSVTKENGLIYLSFYNNEIEEELNYLILSNGVRKYIKGKQKGMIWKFYSDDEIIKLCSKFQIEDFKTTNSGRRQIWLRK